MLRKANIFWFQVFLSDKIQIWLYKIKTSHTCPACMFENLLCCHLSLFSGWFLKKRGWNQRGLCGNGQVLLILNTREMRGCHWWSRFRGNSSPRTVSRIWVCKRPSPGPACWVRVSAARPVTPGWSSRAPGCVSAAPACSGRTARNLCFSRSAASASDASPRPCSGPSAAGSAPGRTWTPAGRLRSGARCCLAGAAAGGGGARWPAGPPVTPGTRTRFHLWDRRPGSGCSGCPACRGGREGLRKGGRARSGERSPRSHPGKAAGGGCGAQWGVPAASRQWGPPSRPRGSGRTLGGTSGEGIRRCCASRSGRPREGFSARAGWCLERRGPSCTAWCQGWRRRSLASGAGCTARRRRDPDSASSPSLRRISSSQSRQRNPWGFLDVQAPQCSSEAVSWPRQGDQTVTQLQKKKKYFPTSIWGQPIKTWRSSVSHLLTLRSGIPRCAAYSASGATNSQSRALVNTGRTSVRSGETHFLHKASPAWCHAWQTTPPRCSPMKTRCNLHKSCSFKFRVDFHLEYCAL